MQFDSTDARICNPPEFDIRLLHGFANSAYREKTLELFLTMYLPHCDQNNGDLMVRPNNFVGALSRAYACDEALKLAVIALGASLLGKVESEEEWVRQGRKMYGKALKETRRALLDQKRANSEALLLVPRIAAIFEMLFGADVNPTIQAQSWRSHAQGELAMFKARGPYALQDDLAHHIFVDGRLPSIIAAIRMRKASILNNVEWKTIPWGKHPKTPKDSLIDILAGIPEILEDIDHLNPKKSDLIEDSARASITIKCRKLETQLQSWATIHRQSLTHPDTENPTGLSFIDYSMANLTILFWTASLFIYGALAVVSPRYTPTSSQSLLLTATDALLYARRIARAVPYFLSSARGIWGATTIAFPMGSSLLCLVHNGMEKNREYLGLAYSAWNNPDLPSAIRDFLNSMKRDAAKEMKHKRPRHSSEFWIF
jgi:hypothetical protein